MNSDNLLPIFLQLTLLSSTAKENRTKLHHQDLLVIKLYHNSEKHAAVDFLSPCQSSSLLAGASTPWRSQGAKKNSERRVAATPRFKAGSLLFRQSSCQLLLPQRSGRLHASLFPSTYLPTCCVIYTYLSLHRKSERASPGHRPTPLPHPGHPGQCPTPSGCSKTH